MAGEMPDGEVSFGPGTVRHVAQLARLDLDEERITEMAREVGRILVAARALQDLDLDGIEAVYRVGWEETLDAQAPTGGADVADEVASGLRSDIPREGLPRDRFLAQAPRRSGPYVAVPTTVDRT